MVCTVLAVPAGPDVSGPYVALRINKKRAFANRRGQLASSSSIFFRAGSSLRIRKLRICPDRAGSRLAEEDPAAWPCFHLAASMVLRAERSALAGSATVPGLEDSAGAMLHEA